MEDFGRQARTVKDPQPTAAGPGIFLTKTQTLQMRRVCRKAGVTVNSFLLKNLTKAIRPFLEDHSSMVPWMIPVNLRGKLVRERDTANYSSYVERQSAILRNGS